MTTDFRTQLTDAFKFDGFDFDRFDIDWEAAATKVNDQVARFGTLAGENYTETNERVLEFVVDTNRKAVDFAVKTADAITDALGDVAEVPFADQLPTAADAGKAYIDFVERAVDMNRDFSKRVVALLPAEKVAAKPAPKAAAKKTAKKAPARKPAAKKAAAKK